MSPHRLLAGVVLGLQPVLQGQHAATATPVSAPIATHSTADAIQDGVRWLAAHQDEDGGFSASLFMRHDPRGDVCTGTGKPDQDFQVTVWAALAMFGTGNVDQVGPEHEAAVRVFRWLRAQKRPDGFLGDPASNDSVTAHAMCCVALRNGKRLDDNEPPKEALQRLVALQLPDGTWPRRPEMLKGDAAATYWAVLACYAEAAQCGVQVDLHPTLNAIDRGFASPLQPGAEAGLRLWWGRTPQNDGRLASLAKGLGKQLPAWPEGAKPADCDFLAWYLESLAIVQSGGEACWRWQGFVRDALLPHQRHDGAHAGSWDPIDVRGREGGRVYSTAVNVMTLELGRRDAGILGPGGNPLGR